jgi:hypothetical protein
MVTEFIKKFPAFYGTRWFFNAITRTHKWTALRQLNPVHTVTSTLRSILIVSSHPCLGLSVSYFQTYLPPTMYAMCPAPLFHLELIMMETVCVFFFLFFFCIWGPHRGGYEEFCLLGYNTVSPGDSQPTIQSRQQAGLCFAACFKVVYCLA